MPGKDGTNGTDGTNCLPGAPGEVVLTRVRSTGLTTSVTATIAADTLACASIDCPDPAHGAPVALTGGNWTQAASQLNLFFGQISLTPPNSSSCTYVNSGSGGIIGPGLMEGKIDDAATGDALATFTASASSTPTATTVPLTVTALFEPGSVVNHALVVKIADNCGFGGAGGGHFTLNSFALDPVGIS